MSRRRTNLASEPGLRVCSVCTRQLDPKIYFYGQGRNIHNRRCRDCQSVITSTHYHTCKLPKHTALRRALERYGGHENLPSPPWYGGKQVWTHREPRGKSLRFRRRQRGEL